LSDDSPVERGRSDAVPYSAFGLACLIACGTPAPAATGAEWLAAAPAQTTRETGALVLAGAKVLDEKGERWLEGQDVLVVGSRIERIAPAASLAAPADARKIDLAGLHLVPGLIDLHSHLLLHPYDETPWDDQVLKESLETRTIRATVAARVTLEAGFTTLRDLGTEGAGFADVALRDAIAKGMIPGPRLFTTTRAIVATGCYGPGAGFDPRWSLPKGAQEATGPDEIRRVVREQIAAGADWVKVYADYRRGKDKAASPTFSQAELDALVDEARSAGKPVAAHATTDEGIRRAVTAGARTIEHGTGVSDATLALMKEKGVVLCPTLAATDAVTHYAGWKAGEPDPPAIADSKKFFARALASGVVIACGSDVGVFAHGTEARELELLVAYGMKPGDALRSATSTAADVLGRGKDLGRIASGSVADLAAFRGDPLADPANLRSPALVVKEGRIAFERR
jgi:imidazolonepropionase-like amidohydrolase